MINTCSVKNLKDGLIGKKKGYDKVITRIVCFVSTCYPVYLIILVEFTRERGAYVLKEVSLHLRESQLYFLKNGADTILGEGVI